jgi:hypothetical protein
MEFLGQVEIIGANERAFRACIHAQTVISSTVILDVAMVAGPL